MIVDAVIRLLAPESPRLELSICNIDRKLSAPLDVGRPWPVNVCID